VRNRWSVTTRCCLEAGIVLRDLQALAQGNAIAADLTGQRLFDAGFAVTVIEEAEAAHRLMHIATHHAFTLVEYFLTDQAGHSQDIDEAYRVLASLDRFFAALLDLLEPDRQLLLISSDHGNLEDLRVRTHTRNPVPLIAWGQGAMHFRHARDLRDITPTIVALLEAAMADSLQQRPRSPAGVP
jgi:2,3-bisphosphoglycerate-independent phosphoglycerate mutase